MTNQQNSNFVGGIGLGLMLGAGAVLMLTTPKGKVWRKKLATMMAEIKAEVPPGSFGLPVAGGSTAEIATMQKGGSLSADGSIRELLHAMYEAVKTEFNELAEPTKDVPKRRRQKKHTFKNTAKNPK